MYVYFCVLCLFAYVKIKVAWFEPTLLFAFYLQIWGGGIFILYPVLNAQLTPVVTANRHFHVTAFSLRCYPKHSIGMFCF